MRDAELGQLPVEPRDLVILLLEGCPHPLKCGVLLLELALRLFPPQTLTPEGGLGLGEGGPLLLELSLRVLACDLFLPEPIFRRGKRSVLVRKAGPQPLRLLSPIFGLALPTMHSLERPCRS
jgi:hypothetical protein